MKNNKNENLKQLFQSPEEFKKSVEEVLGNELVEKVEDGCIYFHSSVQVIDDKTGREFNIPLTQQFIDDFFASLLKKGNDEVLVKNGDLIRPSTPKQ